MISKSSYWGGLGALLFLLAVACSANAQQGGGISDYSDSDLWELGMKTKPLNKIGGNLKDKALYNMSGDKKTLYDTEKYARDLPLYDTQKYTKDLPLYDTEKYARDLPLYDIQKYVKDLPLYDTEKYARDLPLYDTQKYTRDLPLYDTEMYARDLPLYDIQEYVKDLPLYDTEKYARDLPLYDIQKYVRDLPLYNTRSKIKPLNELGGDGKEVYNILEEIGSEILQNTRSINVVDQNLKQKPLREI